jgi:hypothetical protein
MKPEILAAIITAIAGMAGSIIAARISKKHERVSEPKQQDSPTVVYARASELSGSLKADLEKFLPAGIQRPVRYPSGAYFAAIGGTFLGIALAVLYSAIRNNFYLPQLSLFGSILIIATFLIYVGISFNRSHCEIGNNNADIIKRIMLRLEQEK